MRSCAPVLLGLLWLEGCSPEPHEAFCAQLCSEYDEQHKAVEGKPFHEPEARRLLAGLPEGADAARGDPAFTAALWNMGCLRRDEGDGLLRSLCAKEACQTAAHEGYDEFRGCVQEELILWYRSQPPEQIPARRLDRRNPFTPGGEPPAQPDALCAGAVKVYCDTWQGKIETAAKDTGTEAAQRAFDAECKPYLGGADVEGSPLFGTCLTCAGRLTVRYGVEDVLKCLSDAHRPEALCKGAVPLYCETWQAKIEKAQAPEASPSRTAFGTECRKYMTAARQDWSFEGSPLWEQCLACGGSTFEDVNKCLSGAEVEALALPAPKENPAAPGADLQAVGASLLEAEAELRVVAAAQDAAQRRAEDLQRLREAAAQLKAQHAKHHAVGEALRKRLQTLDA